MFANIIFISIIGLSEVYFHIFLSRFLRMTAWGSYSLKLGVFLTALFSCLTYENYAAQYDSEKNLTKLNTLPNRQKKIN